MLYTDRGGLVSPCGLLHFEKASDLRWVLADTSFILFCMQHWCLDGGTRRNLNISNCVVMLSELIFNPRVGLLGLRSPLSSMWKARSFNTEGYHSRIAACRPFSWPQGMSFLPIKKTEAWKQCCWKVPLFRISSVPAHGVSLGSILHRVLLLVRVSLQRAIALVRSSISPY